MSTEEEARSQAAALEPPAPGAPYRAPGDLVAPAPALPAAPRGRPVLGPALGVYGALLWSFVVAGQLTTSLSLGAPLPEALAVLAVMAAGLVALISGVARARRAVPPRSAVHLLGRIMGTGLVGFSLFVVTLIGATVAGQIGASPAADLLVAFVLVGVGVAATVGSSRITAGAPLAVEVFAGDPERRRALRVTLWIMGALVTFVVGVDLALHG
ncbi:MAG: hypothetical protein JWP97_3568 [Labilithrix sp.]|nr:hypothetical protein [Labilithrix sp.]